MSSDANVPSDEEVRTFIENWRRDQPEFVRAMEEESVHREMPSFFEQIRDCMRKDRERIAAGVPVPTIDDLRAEFEELKATVMNRVAIDEARYDALKAKTARTPAEEDEFFQLHLQFGAP